MRKPLGTGKKARPRRAEELREGGRRGKSGQLPDHVGNANGGEGANSECEKRRFCAEA